ncbi:MAG: hypothetical protein JW726_15095 [Anaerolineales bacterium]|nr:hypothetical protein [Anaerolineales bacterium]
MATTHYSGLNLKLTAIPEGAAGNHTVTGIATDDLLLAVVALKLALTEGTPNTLAFSALNLTTEFTITAADTINNTAGTALTDAGGLVLWLDMDAA